MYIQSLELINFRNIEKIKFSLEPETNFFIGNNGQGKSNLLEAVSILSNGRSFRTSKIKECLSWGNSECACACTLVKKEEEVDLRIILKNTGREYWLNNEKLKELSSYLSLLPTISFSPDDLVLIKGGPEERRNFIDRSIATINKSTFDIYSDYHKALKQKNALLKSERINIEEIRIWNKILAEKGSKIRDLRIKLLLELEPQANLVYKSFAPQDGSISLKLKPEIYSSGQELESFYISKYEELLFKEQIVKQTLVGPHRDELEILLNNQPSRVFASQGQSRSLVLALKLALLKLMEEKFDDSPVVLLDDVDSELDDTRSQAFFDFLFNTKRQVLITGTDYAKRKLSKNCKIFSINSGKIS